MGDPQERLDPLLTGPDDPFVPDFSGDSEYEEVEEVQAEEQRGKRVKTRPRHEEGPMDPQDERDSMFSESEVERMLTNACSDRREWMDASQFRSLPDLQSSGSESNGDTEHEEFFEVEESHSPLQDTETNDSDSDEACFEDAQESEFSTEEETNNVEMMGCSDELSSGAEDLIMSGSVFKVDSNTGIISCEAEDWTAYRAEPRRLAYVPFPVRNDQKPSLVLVHGPLTFSRTWSYNHSIFMAGIQLTNTSKYCVSYMAYPSDLRKLTIEQSHGIIQFGKSLTLVVHSDLSNPYNFPDLMDERIILHVAPVKISTRAGLTEEGWDKLEMKHYRDFWASYGTDWFPKAEIQEVEGFVPAENSYLAEPSLTLRKPIPGFRLIRKCFDYISSMFEDTEDELDFLLYKSFCVVLPDGTNKKELLKNEKPYKMSTFEKSVLGLDTDAKDYSLSRTIKKLVKCVIGFTILAFIIVVAAVAQETKYVNHLFYMRAVFQGFGPKLMSLFAEPVSSFSVWKPWTWFGFGY